MPHLPKTPFSNLAISLSGGGYRATAFHLGTLSFLSTIKWQNETLLNRIKVLSTVSGGTFTGVNYATTIKKGGGIEDSYNFLVDFMRNEDLVNDALEILADDDRWENTNKQRTLINAFSLLYFEKLESEKFDCLWASTPEIHLKEICFNATEFNFAIPFRFQKTEKTKSYGYGYIGNNYIRIPLCIAKEIRLADVIAASSCFPLGFEPINFPDDFLDKEVIDDNNKREVESETLPTQTFRGDKISYPVGLMDGGIDDNQGIESVMLAEERMRNYEPFNKLQCNDTKAIDLYIISDVASPYMDSFIRSESSSIPYVGNWSFKQLKLVGVLFFFLGITSFIGSFFVDYTLLTVLLSCVGALSIIFSLITLLLSRGFTGLTKKVGVPSYFTDRIKSFDTLTFNTYYNLIVNRGKSAMTMVSDVFMKQIRRTNYNKIYNDENWRPRLIMNAVYELGQIDVDRRKKMYDGKLSKNLLQPTKKLITVAEKAKDMGTTLWFQSHELEGNDCMLNLLIACGQFTVCFNLLEYIEKTLKSEKYKSSYDGYDDSVKQEIDDLYNSLLESWKKFNRDPYWMVEEWNEKIK